MARVPQDDGSERLIPEAEVLAGLRSGGAGPCSPSSSGSCPTSFHRRCSASRRAVEWAVERTPLLRRLCAHNVVVATRS